MKNKKFVIGIVSIVTAITLSACSGNNENEAQSVQDHSMEMDHSGTSEVPKGLKVAENPTYKVGEKVIIKEGHMEGMEGAEATIVGAYDTIAYTISYTPTDGGEKVENHKWVIQEEIVDAGTEPLKPGTEVKIDADHMKGMDGVTAVIDSAEKTTVYMIDFTLTTNGEKVTNHKWVTESELEAK
ncbi:YdhK family protein [Bacillus sp. DNRA2]|uniref:YdhK family protein n=1 Tax=Bacillus sp. DNRA2 TaxID=2723053 RepID=UPI00145D1A3A|nr:YdhK family protein [Bacillus sp. DNRA2]NMD72425.1 YdhK family protein [Bacillus sp. DNRA2]